MEWDFKNLKPIVKQNCLLISLGCRKRTRFKQMMAKAESEVGKELDLIKFLHRQRLHTYTTMAILDGRQQFIADKMAKMIIRESGDSVSGTEDGSILDHKNWSALENHTSAFYRSRNNVERRLVNAYELKRRKHDLKRHKGKIAPLQSIRDQNDRFNSIRIPGGQKPTKRLIKTDYPGDADKGRVRQYSYNDSSRQRLNETLEHNSVGINLDVLREPPKTSKNKKTKALDKDQSIISDFQLEESDHSQDTQQKRGRRANSESSATPKKSGKALSKRTKKRTKSIDSNLEKHKRRVLQKLTSSKGDSDDAEIEWEYDKIRSKSAGRWRQLNGKSQELTKKVPSHGK